MGGSIDAIPAALLAVVVDECGPIQRVEDQSWDHGEAQVLLAVGTSDSCFVKLHRTADHHRREVHAYENWVVGWSDVPRLLGHIDEPRALAVSTLRGVPGLDVAGPDQPALHHAAGAFIARLHGIDIVDDDIALDQALAQRTDAWLGRADGKVEPAVIDQVRARVAETLPVVAEWSRRACHRDFTERNWIWADGRLSVFDFGIARADLVLADVERLWSSSWRASPRLAEAFWDGYGRLLNDDEQAVLEAYGALQALITVIWAVDHADASFEAAGRDRLRWLLPN